MTNKQRLANLERRVSPPPKFDANGCFWLNELIGEWIRYRNNPEELTRRKEERERHLREGCPHCREIRRRDTKPLDQEGKELRALLRSRAGRPLDEEDQKLLTLMRSRWTRVPTDEMGVLSPSGPAGASPAVPASVLPKPTNLLETT
jgi:hypothetical protein